MSAPPPAAPGEGALEDNKDFMNLYSRQIGAFGMEAMAKLVRLKVLLVGVRGVGVEVAKNLILAGPGAVTLADDGPVAIEDLGANFFVGEADVGRSRAEVCVPKLQPLNKMVKVSRHAGSLTEDVVGAHSAVVFTDARSQAELSRWNTFCRARGIGFIACGVRGAACFAFTDFGDAFTVRDATGETVVTRIVKDITNEEEGLVTLLGQDENGTMHGIPESEHDGWVTFEGVDGMEESGAGAAAAAAGSPARSINTAGPWRVKHATRKETRGDKTVDVFDGYSLRIGDTRALSAYGGGGVLKQHKQPVTVSFRSLDDNLKQPVAPGDFGLMFTDGAKFGRAEQLHFGFVGLWAFEARHGRLPAVGSKEGEDADEVLRLAVEHNDAMSRLNAEAGDAEGPVALHLEALDEDVVRTIAACAAAELQPLCAFLGGVVAQEIVKLTGKFSPLKQWLHLDCFEVLPDERPSDAGADAVAAAGRYAHLVSLFGAAFQQRLGEQRNFMVGCGALGCEFLKNFALLGISCGPGGLVTVTDNDRIEVSNLNRQFLFREHNVGHFKSEAASTAVKEMNGSLNARCLTEFVAATTEDKFDDDFWGSLDLVTNALDNVKARVYVDSRCVFYGKPLLESGTLGVKCNVQVVLPHKTESYSDGPTDAEDDNIPMCTLRNFPSLIEHCIEWSRAQFTDVFGVPAGSAKKFVEDRAAFLAEIRAKTVDHPNRLLGRAGAADALDTLRSVRQHVMGGSPAQLEPPAAFEACVAEAFALFHTRFRDNILQLVHNFPEDKVNEAGERFWSGAKRFPQAAAFDEDDELHMGFLIATTNLLAVGYGVQPPPEVQLLPEHHSWRDPETFKAVVHKLPVPVWTPSDETIAASDTELKKQQEEKRRKVETEADAADGGSDWVELQGLLAELEACDLTGLTFQDADFEKDVDENFHIDFVTAASNLRAWNYRIAQTTRHQCKMIAGKIIPAIATTTASVCGLVMVELLKLVQRKPLEAFKNSSNSLGLNMYMMQEPGEPVHMKDEYDPIEMSEVKTMPKGFTKWDKMEVKRGPLTMAQFISAFKEITGLTITMLYHQVAMMFDNTKPEELVEYKPVSGRMLYDSCAWKAELAELYKSKADTDLAAWVRERYEHDGLEVVPKLRKYIELQASCEDDGGTPYKIPTLVYYFDPV